MPLLSKVVMGFYFLFLGVWLFLWKGHLPYYVDASLYAYPDHSVNLQAFRQGLLPLWNPFIGCGTPHAANWQSACFYPPFWLFNLTGLSDGFMGMAVVHVGLAFVGCYLWLRDQKAAPLWCALGALSFAASAHLTRCSANLPFIATAAWIPWVFWAFHRSLERPVLKNWITAGLILGLQVLAGYPFFTFYTVLFLVVWFEFQKPSAPNRGCFWLTLAFSALLTSLQWLPFLELLTYAKPDSWAQYPYFDRPLDYLTLLKPDVLGILGSASYRGPFANGTFNMYFGLIPLVVLALTIVFFLRRKDRFWSVASLFWLFWMAGASFPLWRMVPLGALEWLEPSKAVGLFLFCAVTLAASSLSRFFENNLPQHFQVTAAALLAVLWVADLSRMPSLLLQPMPDPYQRADYQENARKIIPFLAGGRMLSLHNPDEMAFTGAESEALERTFDFPIRMELANSNAVWGIRSADRYLFLQVDGSENLVKYYNKSFPYKGGLLDLAGVRLFLLPQTLPAPKYMTVGKLGNDFFILNRKISPDLRWVGQETDFPGRADILEKLAQPGSGWETHVDLEKKADGAYVQLAALSRNLTPNWTIPRNAGTASYLLDENETKRPGYVVFNETYAPGWHAWADGIPQPILRAYGLFMGVRLEGTGTHRVDFRYEPSSFRMGLFLTLLALAFLGGALLKGYGSPKKPA